MNFKIMSIKFCNNALKINMNCLLYLEGEWYGNYYLTTAKGGWMEMWAQN